MRSRSQISRRDGGYDVLVLAFALIWSLVSQNCANDVVRSQAYTKRIASSRLHRLHGGRTKDTDHSSSDASLIVQPPRRTWRGQQDERHMH